MASLGDIKRRIAALSRDGLAEFRAWFEKFDAANWERQLEEDARSGKLDVLAEEALEDCRKGRCKELARSDKLGAAAEKAVQAQMKAQQGLRRLRGKVRWEGDLAEMRRDC